MSTAGGRTAKSGFVTATLSAEAEGWTTVIEWTHPDTVKTTLELQRDGETSRFERMWKETPEGLTELQSSLASLRTGGSGWSGAISLVLGGEHDSPAIHLWSAGSEPANLMAARVGLERVGHLDFARAALLLERGRASRAAGHDAASIRDLAMGLQALGDSYSHPSVIDDTGMMMVLAQYEQEQGNLPAAAILYERVLESRVTVYEQLHRELVR
jgi:ABC-type transporter Mla MlaB component